MLMNKLHCIPNLNETEEYIKLTEEYGLAFEYNEFFSPKVLTDEKMCEDILCRYKGLMRDGRTDTLHGAFYDINVASDDPAIYEVSDKRIIQSMEAAKQLSAKGVIFHTNYIANFTLESYRETWLKRNEEYYRKLCKKYPDIEIYVENMFDEDPELLTRLCESMKDVPNFGACFDFAHAYVSITDIEDWLSMLSPYIKHVHINDNYGTQDLHLAVGDGTLPWEVYDAFMRSRKEEDRPSVLIEVSGTDKLKRSLQYMKKNGIYPF